MRLKESSFSRKREETSEAQHFLYLRDFHTMVEAVFGKNRAADFVLRKEERPLAQLVGQLYDARYPLIQSPPPRFFGINAYFAVPIVIIELMRSVVPSLKKELSRPLGELLESGASKWLYEKPSLKGNTWTWDGSRILSEYDLEIAKYTLQIAQNPRDPEPYVRRANVWLIHKSDYDRAIADYTEAIRLNPTDASAYNWRGHAFKNKGLYREAMDSFNEAIRLCPSEPGHREGLALCYEQQQQQQQQDYASAIKEYIYLLELDPKRTKQYLEKNVRNFMNCSDIIRKQSMTSKSQPSFRHRISIFMDILQNFTSLWEMHVSD